MRLVGVTVVVVVTLMGLLGSRRGTSSSPEHVANTRPEGLDVSVVAAAVFHDCDGQMLLGPVELMVEVVSERLSI